VYEQPACSQADGVTEVRVTDVMPSHGCQCQCRHRDKPTQGMCQQGCVRHSDEGGTAHTTHPHSPRSHTTPTLRRDVYAAPRRGTVRTTVCIHVLVHKDPMKNTLKVLDGLTFCGVFEKLSAAQKRYLCLPRRLMHGAIELCMDEPFWLACGAAARMMSA
jgi:hypothetical protein